MVQDEQTRLGEPKQEGLKLERAFPFQSFIYELTLINKRHLTVVEPATGRCYDEGAIHSAGKDVLHFS